jgi:hypothetical protein
MPQNKILALALRLIQTVGAIDWPGVTSKRIESGRRLLAPRIFWCLLMIGALVRGFDCFATIRIDHPDEHQQYLEIAQGLAHGPHFTPWEYERGTRHYLYPAVLAAELLVLERLGIVDPLEQYVAMRLAMSLTVLAVMAVLALDLARRGYREAAWFLLTFAVFSMDWIRFYGSSLLSETATIIPLVLGLITLRDRPMVGGLMFTMTFAIRVQNLPLSAAAGLIVLAHDIRPDSSRLNGPRATPRFALGLGFGMLAIGLADYLTWGAWFHSAIQSIQVNALEGIAGRFGTDPWYFYLENYTKVLIKNSIFLPVFVLVGMVKDRATALQMLVFVLMHSAIGHKEMRFLWPIAPLWLLLGGLGFEVAFRALAPRFRIALVVLMVASALAGDAHNLRRIKWNEPIYRSSALGLWRAGHESDLSGIAICGTRVQYTGNYFFLRRDVPLIVDDPAPLRISAVWQSGAINYLLVDPKDVGLFADVEPVEVARCDLMVLYRVRTPGSRRGAVGEVVKPARDARSRLDPSKRHKAIP